MLCIFSLHKRAENAVGAYSYHGNKDDGHGKLHRKSKEDGRDKEHQNASRKGSKGTQKAHSSRKTALYALHSADVNGILF